MDDWTEIALLAVSLVSLLILAGSLLREAASGKEEKGRKKRNAKAQADPGKNPSKLERQLKAAGMTMHPNSYRVFALLLALVGGMLALELTFGAVLPALLGFILTLGLLQTIIREFGKFRAIRFEEKLVDAVDLMCAALQGGETTRQAMESTAACSENPIKAEFNEFARRIDLGMDIRRALRHMMLAYDSEGVKLFGSTLITKWSAGGDLCPVLQSVNQVMRERLKHRLRLRNQLAGAQFSAFAVGLAPYLLFTFFFFYQPDWVLSLFSHPMGPTLLFSAILLQLIGFVWLYRLMKVEL